MPRQRPSGRQYNFEHKRHVRALKSVCIPDIYKTGEVSGKRAREFVPYRDVLSNYDKFLQFLLAVKLQNCVFFANLANELNVFNVISDI